MATDAAANRSPRHPCTRGGAETLRAAAGKYALSCVPGPTAPQIDGDPHVRPRRPRFLAVLAAAIAFVLAPSALAPAHAEEPTTGTITGTVTGPDGELLSSDDWAGVTLRNAYSSIAWVDVDPGTGTYAFANVSPGSYRLMFRYVGDAGLIGEYWSDAYYEADAPFVQVVAGETLTLHTRLERGAVVRGTLTGSTADFGPNKYGKPRASINALRTGQVPQNRIIDLAEDGSFTSKPLPPGEYRAGFSNGPYWTTEDHNGEPWASSTGAPLVLTLGAVIDLDIVLDPVPAVAGTVTVIDSDGTSQPYSGEGLRLVSENGDTDRAGSVWPTGTFEVHGVTPGSYTVRVEPHRSTLALPGEWRGDGIRPALLHVDEGEWVSGIDIELRRGGSFRADLTYAGQPIWDGGMFSIWRYDETEDAYLPVVLDRPAGWRGAVTAPVLEPGRYAVHFASSLDESIGGEFWQDARYFAARTDVVVEEGIDLDLGEVALEPRYFDVGRLGGTDRFATAVEISKAAIEDGRRAPVVYVANAFNFPDALAAGPAAMHAGGVVLTVPADRIPPVVAAELARIRPERIVVAGGTGSVSAAVFRQLAAYVDDPADLDRLGGATRYDTARLIVDDAFGDDGAPTAFVATAANFPDALAAGPAAGALRGPVILVDGAARSVDAATAALISDLGVTDVLIAGGPGSVSGGVEASLASLVGGSDHVVRLAGPDRYATAAAVNGAVFDETEYALIASGTGFPDALAGGPLAGMLGAPIHLSPGSCIPASAAAGIVDSGVLGVLLLGGPGALGASVESLTLCG